MGAGNTKFQREIPNPARRAAIIWWVMCGVLAAGIFIPVWLEAAGVYAAEWASALFFSCLVAGVTALIMAVIYTKRARLAGRLLGKRDILAHWRYPPEEWRDYTEKEHARNIREKKSILVTVAIISILIGMFFSVTVREMWHIFIFMVIGIIMMMALALWLAVWMRYRQNQNHTGEIYISNSGMLLNRELYVWEGNGARLEEAVFEADGDITITYSVPNRNNRQFVGVRVPVPRGQEAIARSIVECLSCVLGTNKHSRR